MKTTEHNTNNELFDSIKQLIESHNQLAQEAVEQYRPIVEHYINDNCTDSNKIAHTLDFMLDFCFDDQMLLLYRRLCRYLYHLDPETTTFYINAYREIWDEEGLKFGKKDKDETI